MILVIGSGLLGTDLITVLHREFGEVTGTYNTKPKPNSIHLNITDRDECFKAIRQLKPEVIIHSAALTNVDYCEDHKEEAILTNANGTKNIVDAAKKNNAKVVYVSTDFVFDGKKGMYKEDDPVNPISVYAYSKLLGEYYTLGVPGNVITRTSVIYGNARQNYVSWVRDSLKAGTKIKIVTDQFNSPTLSIDLAEAIAALTKSNATGIYHTAGGERISRFDFAKKIAKYYGLDDSPIEAVTSDTLNQKAKRPMDSSLDVSKVSKYHKMADINTGLEIMEESLTK